jgi:hypothetical protein
MATVIAQDIALYLQSLGEGTLGTDIFVDYQPDLPDETVTIYDVGGNNPNDPPEEVRNLNVQIRSARHETGYERAWRVLSYLLYPANNIITVGQNSYIMHLVRIPAVFNRDKSNRYLIDFETVCHAVFQNSTNDSWLTAISAYVQGILPTGWTIYMVWQGNKRPSLCWEIVNISAKEQSRYMYKLSKRIVCNILGDTPANLQYALATITQALEEAVKIPLDIANKKYMAVDNIKAQKSISNYTVGQITIDVSQNMPRTFVADAPILNGFHDSGQI